MRWRNFNDKTWILNVLEAFEFEVSDRGELQ